MNEIVVQSSCDVCGAQVGPRFIEDKIIKVAGYGVCSWCLKKLSKKGKLIVEQISPFSALYLFPDGHTEKLSIGG